MAVKFKERKKQSGMAMIETLPLLVIFVLLLFYGLGFLVLYTRPF